MKKDKKAAFKKALAKMQNDAPDTHKDCGKTSLTINVLTALESAKARAMRKLRNSLSSRQNDRN